MKFQDLVLLIEAKGTKPGQRYKSAQDSTGPAGISASPIGRSDYNPEKRTNDKREFFDNSNVSKEQKAATKNAYQEESRMRSRMGTAFALLFNEPIFFKKFKKIISERLIIHQINAEDERNFNIFKDAVDRAKGKSTEARNEHDDYVKELRKWEEDKERSEEIKFHIENLKNSIKREKNSAMIKIYNDDLKVSENDLKEIRPENIDKAIKHLTTQVENAFKKLVAAEQREIDHVNAYNELQDKIQKVTVDNLKSNDSVIKGIKILIQTTADLLIDEYTSKYGDEFAQQSNNIDPDWDTIPKDINEKLAMLAKLKTEDNPIFDFIDELTLRHEEFLTDMDERFFNRNINITMMRGFEKLPAVIVAKYFNDIAGRGVERKTIPMQNLDTSDAYSAFEQFKKRVKTLKDEDFWNKHKKGAMDMINLLPFTKFNKDSLKDLMSQPWSKNRRGQSIADQVIFRLESIKNEESRNMKNESFDKFASKVLKNIEFDADDFKIDLMEILESKSKKCTGPTKKASSNRKDKKWTKCAKQPDGSYKRIHWGEAGVRVGSGNSKRKKSFKARHNCKNAKAGSANALSCSDWS
jgi:hypothetical protein